MRRPRLALSSALAAIGLSAAVASAQQQPQRGPTPLSRPPSPISRALLPEAPPSDTPLDPMLASKATRYLLRNGMDYLAYREYARALSFFRAVEARQSELTPADLDALKKGIARAQQGLREAVNSTRVVSQPVKGRAAVQPGALALAQPPTAESVRLASAELPAPPPVVPPAAPPAAETEGVLLPQLPAREIAPATPSEPLPDQPSPAPTPTPTPTQDGPEVVPAALPASPPPPIGLELPGAPEPSPAPASSPIELPPTGPAPMPAEPTPAPAPAPVPVPVDAPAPAAETSPTPIELPPGNSAPASMPSEPLPLLPGPAEPVPADAIPPRVEPVPADAIPSRVEPVPADAIPSRVALAPERVDASPPAPMPADPGPSAPAPAPASSPIPESPPAAEAAPLPPLPGEAAPARPNPASGGEVPESILPPHLRREIEELAQAPRGADRPPGGAAPAAPADPNAPTMPSQGSTRLELQRAPSPTEARPIRRVPVPEEYVPLGAREWSPGRKYWAAAGTCHMILYFQDPVLERYGQGVEQALGPNGRYFSYPLDDPRQSNQRNQILQPFYSIGKFCFQVGTLPYKVLMDPPWEAEYDLGYFRPGDPIPADTIMITPTGVGPPLKGRHY